MINLKIIFNILKKRVVENFDWKNLWYNSRFEYRRRWHQKNDIFRYRPQFGIKGKTYVIFEPHIQYTYETEELKYSYMQTVIGHELFKKGNVKIVPFFEIDTDEYFKFDLIFFGVDIKWTVKL